MTLHHLFAVKHHISLTKKQKQIKAEMPPMSYFNVIFSWLSCCLFGISCSEMDECTSQGRDERLQLVWSEQPCHNVVMASSRAQDDELCHHSDDVWFVSGATLTVEWQLGASGKIFGYSVCWKASWLTVLNLVQWENEEGKSNGK